jgi:hypothetical protein
MMSPTDRGWTPINRLPTTALVPALGQHFLLLSVQSAKINHELNGETEKAGAGGKLAQAILNPCQFML